MYLTKNYYWLILLALFFSCKEKSVRVIPVNSFFKSQDKATYRISPDGKCLAYLKLQNKQQNLFVENIATGKVTQLTKLNQKSISFYAWVSNNDLIYYKEKEDAKRHSDLYIISKQELQERQLSKNDKIRVRVLDDQLIDNKFWLVLSNQRDSTQFDVYRLNVRDGKMDIAAKNPGNITSWITDAKGKLRMAISSDGVNETLLYRKNEQEAFKPIVTNNFKTTLRPIAFAEDKKDVIYAISDVNRDKKVLVELDCNTGKENKVLFGNNTLNVVDAQYSKVKDKITYVVYENWKKEKHFLDDTVKALYKKLDKLLPATESRIVNRDKAENVFIVRTFTDRNPGCYYLYFANTGKIKKLSDLNSDIKENEMCEMKPIKYANREGITINGYLTLPLNKKKENLALIVLPHNGPVGRNVWGYNAEVQFFANRGYAVFQVNYRGSAGYGKAFLAAGFKQWGAKINNDINDGVQWLITNKIVSKNKVAIYGTGFGGYIALNNAFTNPNLYVCAASNAGVINLFCYLKAIPPYLKADLQMYYDIIGNPDTDAEYMRQASPVFHSDKINMPVFIAQNTKDIYVNSNEVIQFVKELKKRNVPVTYLEKQENFFSVNGDENRKKMYAALEQFLANNLKNK